MARALLALAAAAAVAAQESWDATLVLHSDATAAQFNARCLDGSKGGFYFRPASSPSAATKWKFHFMGGGWCDTPASCFYRSKSLLGSSSFWPPTLSKLWPPEFAGFYGLMSANDTSVNPFGAWNFVWFGYCDGSSQMSDNALPVLFNGTALHMRGRALLDAHLAELEAQHGFLSTATEVIVSGTSAGGQSTYMHSSFIKSQLRAPGARLVAVPDAGFWWATRSYKSPDAHPFLDMVTRAMPMWNGTLRGGSGRCLQAPPYGNRNLCFVQPYNYPFAFGDVEAFVVQSLVDPANLGICYDMPCSLSGSAAGSCSAEEVAAILDFSHALKANITAAQAAFGLRDGHFFDSCSFHEQTCRSFDYFGVKVAGQTMNSSFYSAWGGGLLVLLSGGGALSPFLFPTHTSTPPSPHYTAFQPGTLRAAQRPARA
jgi:hypothetical protein